MPMKEREIRKEQRKQAAIERLGSANPCARCGEADPRCLELHHLAGQKFDEMCVPVCRNCHKKLSDLQRDHPHALSKRKADKPDLLETIGHFLLGLADFLALLVEKLREFGHNLIDLAKEKIERDGHDTAVAGGK